MVYVLSEEWQNGEGGPLGVFESKDDARRASWRLMRRDIKEGRLVFGRKNDTEWDVCYQIDIFRVVPASSEDDDTDVGAGNDGPEFCATCGEHHDEDSKCPMAIGEREAQPTLPGADSVRTQDVPMPPVADVPFSLSGETDRAIRGTQLGLVL
jgi:hypothetical protein